MYNPTAQLVLFSVQETTLKGEEELRKIIPK